tara:strand:- start:4622 stop:4774 length:153 start_codon:yes stop_codon:yes gene_type:complete
VTSLSKTKEPVQGRGFSFTLSKKKQVEKRSLFVFGWEGFSSTEEACLIVK